LVTITIVYQPVGTRAAGQSGRPLPAILRSPQVSPDFVINNGLGAPPPTGDFNGDGMDDFLVTLPLPCFECTPVDPLRFGIFFGKRDAQFHGIDLYSAEPDLSLNTKSARGLAFISTVGDVNGDGKDDLVLHQQFTGNAAVAKIFYGSRKLKPGAIDIDARPPDLQIIIPAALGISGLVIAGTADVNGDGEKDLLLALSGLGLPSTAAILLGPFASGATIDLRAQPPDITIQVTGWFDIIHGILLADVNGDHRADLLFGKSTTDSQTGRRLTSVDVIFGSASWKHGTVVPASAPADATFDAAEDMGNLFTQVVIQTGDVNNDGMADVLIGLPSVASLESPPPPWFTGSVNIFFGAKQLHGRISQPDVVIAGLPTPNPLRQIPFTLGDHLGEALAVGDVNGDAIPDILICAPGQTSDAVGQVLSIGRAYIIIGSPELKSGTRIETSRYQPDVTIYGYFYRAAIGDFNGDGIGDINVTSALSTTIYYGGPLRAPEITDASYQANVAELVIRGSDFTGSTRVKINGNEFTGEVTCNADQDTLVLHGSKGELNLRDGKNKIFVRGKGERSNTFKLKLT
jgi:hypothetical protein